jgi:hypothetical protein
MGVGVGRFGVGGLGVVPPRLGFWKSDSAQAGPLKSRTAQKTRMAILRGKEKGDFMIPLRRRRGVETVNCRRDP